MKKLFGFTLFTLVLLVLCGCELFPNTNNPTTTPEHTHTYAEEWSKDANDHWHAATCEHAEEVSDKASHTWDVGEVTTPATEEAAGVKTFTCTVCGQTKEEAIAQLEHTHKFSSDWSKDDINHWHAATCEHTEEVSELGSHTYDEGVETKPATTTEAGIKTFTCTECGHSYTETIDRILDIEDENWTAVGNKDAYFYLDGKIYANNVEDLNNDNHFNLTSTNYNIHNTKLGAHYTVSVNIKGTYTGDVDCEMDAGIVVWYVDANNYIVAGVKWADWDRAHEVRSVWFKGMVNGEKFVSGDYWTDNCGTAPADGIKLTVTKVKDVFKFTFNGFGAYVKEGYLTIAGTDSSEASVGIYGANDEFEYTNFEADDITPDPAVYTATINEHNYVVKLSVVDDSFDMYIDDELVGSGTYTREGRIVTLTIGDETEKMKISETGFYTGTFEPYEEPTEEIVGTVVDGSVERAYHTLAETYQGDFVLKFNYVGKCETPGVEVLMGAKWSTLDGDYVDIYAQWGDGGRPNDIRNLQITGSVGGVGLGWNDIWCDGSKALPADGGLITITKVGNNFSVKVECANGFVKEGSKTVESLDLTKTYKLELFAQSDIITFYNVELYSDISSYFTVSGDGSAVLRSDKLVINNATAILNQKESGDYSFSFDYVGLIDQAGTKAVLTFYAWYIDADNYIEVYAEWGDAGRPNDIRNLQITGYINGTHIGWNDIWCDGSNVLPADGGTLTISKVGNVITAKVVSGTFVKEGSATIAALDTTLEYAVGFKTDSEFTLTNIQFA